MIPLAVDDGKKTIDLDISLMPALRKFLLSNRALFVFALFAGD